MILVIERYDGVDSVTPFWCEKKANTLLNKILKAGGEAKIKYLQYST